MGPIALFDKSFLQSLSTDEAVWFDNFFYPVTTPLFYIETLADLWKTPREGKTAEEEVAIIAAKTPELHGGPCFFHHELCIQDLHGHHVPLDGRIPMANMRRVVRDGKEGAIAEVSDEAKAFHRWQHGEFEAVEHLYARRWRGLVESIDLSIIEKSMKSIGVSAKNCKSLEAALAYADQAVAGLTKSSGRFDGALEVLEIPDADRRFYIKELWKHKGKPPLSIFAPYAAHMLRVELFFRIALGANKIASTRPSHKVDMAYLFYLPFCSIFISSDKLHRQCSPLFMRPDQEFVWGHDLKADLAELNEHFGGLPDEVKQQGLYKFASRLPDESKGLIRQIFERHTPNLLTPAAVVDTDMLNQTSAGKKIIEDMKKWESSPSDGSAPAGRELETMIIKRSIRRQRGSWVQIGPEITDSEEK